MRGNHALGTGDVERLGSIPACAGKPRSMPSRSSAAWVYPRVCGETDSHTAQELFVDGLSPRVRGNPVRRSTPCRRRRSIPACAGKPDCTMRMAERPRVYPRVCGETRSRIIKRKGQEGLSPRVRGNLPGHLHEPDHAGSIPACAGKPPGRCPSRATPWVYPRVCGETSASS